MNMNNVKGNFFVNGEDSENKGVYCEKIRNQFMCGCDLYALDKINEYYVQNSTLVEPANYHPLNDGYIFLPTRNFDLKENNLYFEDLAILAYITSFVNNTKDVDDLSFIKTKNMIDQSGTKVIYRTIPLKILTKVLEDIVGENQITFDFKKIKTYDPDNTRNVLYLSTMSKNTISIHEIYRVLNYIQDVPDACEFLYYCYIRLDIYHQKFLTEISKTSYGRFPFIKYNPYTDELYILKEYGDLMLDNAIDVNAEKMKQRLLRHIDSKNVFRIDAYKYLEYVTKFIPDEMSRSRLLTNLILKLKDTKRSGIKLDEICDGYDFKIMAEFLIDVLNHGKSKKYLTNRFDTGIDKFNNFKIKLYKV